MTPLEQKRIEQRRAAIAANAGLFGTIGEGGLAYWSQDKEHFEKFKQMVAAKKATAAPVVTQSGSFADAVAAATPEQSDIPAFEVSGLWNEDDAGKTYDQYYGGYNQRQLSTLNREKQLARDTLLRTIRANADAAAASEQTGSGADIKARALANQGFNQTYEDELGDWRTRVQNTKDTQGVSRYDFLNKLKDEAYQRYLQRYQTQASS